MLRGAWAKHRRGSSASEKASGYGFVDIRKQFGRRIIELRQERGWTQEELASTSGISTRSISNIENGVFSVTLDTIDKLARSYSVTIRSLFDFQQGG